MIDLHSHTNASDGTDSPQQLIDRALALNLEALSITDHDNFFGYDAAVPIAAAAGLDLVRGIEVSTKYVGQSVHLLGYWIDKAPTQAYLDWLWTMQEGRRDRNRRLIKRLQDLNVDITLEEAEAMGGNMTGRPHIARILVRKGYVTKTQEAFDKYLAEGAQGYVDRLEAPLPEAIQLMRDGNGIPVLAHPVRMKLTDRNVEKQVMTKLADAGLGGIEIIHSDHSPEDTARYSAYAKELGLKVTGGSDFHGDTKPHVQLGTGFNGNVAVDKSILDQLRS